MNKKNESKLILLLLVIVFVIIGSVRLYQNIYINNCIEHYYTFLRCVDVSLFGYGYLIIMIPMLGVITSLIPLYFTRESTYKAWRKFAMVALPLMIVGIIATRDQTGGMGGSLGFPADQEQAAMLYSALFVIISYILIIVKTIKTGKKK